MNNAGTLKVTMPTGREIVMTRDFDAPGDLLYDALTQPEHLQRWQGPQGWSLPVCEVDLKVGGPWRSVMRRDDGVEFHMGGVYRELLPPRRIVRTEGYGHADWGEILVTIELVTHPDDPHRTTLISTSLYPTQEIRDANAGVAQGAGQSFDKLAAYLDSLQ